MVTVYRVPASASTPSHVVTPACALWSASPVQTVYSQVSSSPVILGPTTTLSSSRQVAAPSATLLASPVAQHRLTTATTPVKAERRARHSAPTPPHGSESLGVISLGTRRFERLRELGRGSFGVVYEAQEVHAGAAQAGEAKSPAVALKCSKPTSKQMFEACLLEAEILRRLGAALPAEVAAANRVPRYITHCVVGEVVPGSPSQAAGGSHGKSQVLVAMSKLEGRPLDQWLYGVDENRLKTVAVSQVLEGPFPEGHFGTQDIVGACQLVVDLISQLAPIFTPLDGIAFHRDVSAHNFLIRGEVGQAHFALLDFGLAVRASTWQQEFQSRNISGDPRYFTPAAWMLMVYGHKYLEAHPDASFLEQYKSRLDHYSFGLLILEVLFGLWRAPDASEEASASTKVLARVRQAWHGLWGDAMRFFQMFHGKGFAATREALARSQAVSKYADKLRTLCSELRLASETLAGSRETAAIAAVLTIAAGLVDPRATLAWREVPQLLHKALPKRLGVRGQGATVESPTASPVSDSATSTSKTTVVEEASTDASSSDGAERDAAGEAAPASECSSMSAEVAAGGAVATGELDEAVTGAAPNGVDEPATTGVDEPATNVEASAVANSGDDAASTQQKAPRPSRMYSHRRNWTVDEAVSLTRGVPEPEVAMGWAVVPPEPAAASTN